MQHPPVRALGSAALALVLSLGLALLTAFISDDAPLPRPDLANSQPAGAMAN